MANEKRERFVRVAEARTNKAIDMLRLLGNCSDSRNYEYDKEDVDKIFASIDAELKRTKARFAQASTKQDRFKL